VDSSPFSIYVVLMIPKENAEASSSNLASTSRSKRSRESSTMKSAIYQLELNEDGQPKKRRRKLTEGEKEARKQGREARQKAAAEYSSDPDDEDFDDSLPVDDSGSENATDTDSDVNAEMSNDEVSLS
jgi:hypothetical protein